MVWTYQYGSSSFLQHVVSASSYKAKGETLGSVPQNIIKVVELQYGKTNDRILRNSKILTS
jgi:hypothetical protein